MRVLLIVCVFALVGMVAGASTLDCYNACTTGESNCARLCPNDGVSDCFDVCVYNKQNCMKSCDGVLREHNAAKLHSALQEVATIGSIAKFHHHHHHDGGAKHHFWPSITIIHHAEEEVKGAFTQYISDYAKSYAEDEYPTAYANFRDCYDLVQTWNGGKHRFALDLSADSDKSADDLPDEPTQALSARHFGGHHHWWPHLHISKRDITALKHTFEKYIRDFAKAYLQAEFPVAYEAFSDVYDVVEAWKHDRHRFSIIYGIYSDLTEDEVPPESE